MVTVMVNKPLATPLLHLTPIPVLVKSSDTAPLHGVGTLFPNPKDTLITGLHVVSTKEASAYAAKWAQSHRQRWGLVNGLAWMQRAQRDRNWPLFQQALDETKKWIPHDFESDISYVRGSQKWKDVGFTYSSLISNLLQTAHFIIWYTKDNRIHPGLYCSDWEVAVYAILGMDGIRICKKPGCERVFIPRVFTPGSNTQEYCPGGACANAERVARSKANKKAREKLARG
jgi:hypothetical protein